MKFMGTWRLPPKRQPAAVDRFLATGASVPEGVTLLGRRHAPGSMHGFVLFETDDLTALAAHQAEWSDVVEITLTPVIEDAEVGEAMARMRAARAESAA
jgi:hypothetical protein